LSKEINNGASGEGNESERSNEKLEDGCYINRGWTEEEDKLLTSKIGRGETAQEIALALGRTRNSVIGRAWRLKNRSHAIRYDKGRSYKKTLGYKKVVRREKEAKARACASKKSDRENLLKFLQGRKALDARKSKRALHKLIGRKSNVSPAPACDIHALREGHCRYIISGTSSTGEDSYKYCGQPTIYKSYCYAHANVVYANEFEGDCSTISDHSAIDV
jgi:hypothetical protein